MLYPSAQMPRHHVAYRGGLKAAKKKKRFEPIRHGKFTLVRIEFDMQKDEHGNLVLDKDKNTIPAIRVGEKVTSISFKCTIVEGQQEGRWFFDRFVLKGHGPSVLRTRRCLHAMISCFDPTMGEKRLGLLHGRVVPVMVRQEPHYMTGRIQNEIIALSPNPDFLYDGDVVEELMDALPPSDAETDGPWRAYHEIVKRCMRLDDQGCWASPVPGWDLYPSSKSEKLVLKRQRDRQELFDGAGVSAIDMRRRDNSVKAVRRMAAA